MLQVLHILNEQPLEFCNSDLRKCYNFRFTGNKISQYGLTTIAPSARLLLHPADNYGNTGCGVIPKANFTEYTNYLTKKEHLNLQAGTVIFGNVGVSGDLGTNWDGIHSHVKFTYRRK